MQLLLLLDFVEAKNFQMIRWVMIKERFSWSRLQVTTRDFIQFFKELRLYGSVIIHKAVAL